MIDLSGIVAAFYDSTITVTRSVTAWGVDGRPTSTSSTLSTGAMLCPSKKKLRSEPQGGVIAAGVDIYTSTVLLPLDSISYLGSTYVVDSIDEYSTTGGFYVAHATKVLT